MVLNILDYGARVSDEVMTREIQNAIDACHNAGGGEVVIPAGVYRTGSIWLRSGVALHLLSGAILEGSDNTEDYAYVPEDLRDLELLYVPLDNTCGSTNPYSRWSRAIIKAVRAEDISVIGDPNSYIDGVNCYDELGEEQYRGPHPINLNSCKNVCLKGYTVKNGGNWGHAIFASENIEISDVTVLGGHDGIDVFICENVVIKNCKLYTGDDCIAGYGSKNVSVDKCDFSTACSVLRFGGTDVKVTDCRQCGPARFAHRLNLNSEEKARRVVTSPVCRRNTLTAFLYYCDFRFDVKHTPGNIVFENCDFEYVDAMFLINFGNHIWCNNVSLESVAFKKCTFRELKNATYIYTDKNLPFTLLLEDVDMYAKDGYGHKNVICGAEFDKIIMKNVHFHGFESPTITLSCDGEIISENTDAFETAREEYQINSTYH